MVPKPPAGAEHTSPTVRGVIARFTSSMRGTKLGRSTSTSTSSIPISSAPIRKLKCMVTGATICGCAFPPCARASRIAARFDSVPPLVMKPAPSGAPSSDAIMRTASRSIAMVPGCCSAAHSTK